MYAIMQGFGSLACYLYARILKICRECFEENNQVRDLRQIYSVTLATMKGLSKRRRSADNSGEDEDLIVDDRRYIELRFMIIILDFFNYHISLAKREHTSRLKIEWLVRNLLPSID